MIALALGVLVLTLVFVAIGYAQDDKTFMMAGGAIFLLFLVGFSLLFFGVAWFPDIVNAVK
jgi:hypothetical protein